MPRFGFICPEGRRRQPPIIPPFKWMVTERLKNRTSVGLINTPGAKGNHASVIVPIEAERPLHSSSVSLLYIRGKMPADRLAFLLTLQFLIATPLHLIRPTNDVSKITPAASAPGPGNRVSRRWRRAVSVNVEHKTAQPAQSVKPDLPAGRESCINAMNITTS